MITAKEVRNLILEAVWTAMREGKLPDLKMADPEVYPDKAKIMVLTQTNEYFEVSVERRGP